MSEELLETVEVGAGDEATASVIWLHGLGADGHDFEAIVPELGLPADARLRFVFPHAPVQPVTVNGGMPMRAWYDLYGIGVGVPQDDAGVRASETRIHDLIRRENERGVPPRRLVLAGFSQGGALALHTGLRYPQRLAGIMGLSTYLPLHHAAVDERHAANNETSIFLAHGYQDPVLPFALGESSRRWLVAHGYTVEWHEYTMAHQLCLEEIGDVARWLKGVLELTR